MNDKFLKSKQSHWSITTPQSLGSVNLTFTDSYLTAISFSPASNVTAGPKLGERWQQWFNHYFSGTNPGQTPPYRLIGTDFQRQVWAALTQIPYGETRSYGEIAQAISRPTAVRAVATAIGKNPLPMLIPCHRVIQANGKISNYSGGVDKKKALLALESQNKFDI